MFLVITWGDPWSEGGRREFAVFSFQIPMSPLKDNILCILLRLSMARMNWGREQELNLFSFLLDTRKVFQLGLEEPSGS